MVSVLGPRARERATAGLVPAAPATLGKPLRLPLWRKNEVFLSAYLLDSLFGKKGDLPHACPPCPGLAYEQAGHTQALASSQISLWDLS